MQKPNVVVFFTDQQRWDSVGLHGNPLGLTPNFDRVARRNTHIANSFTCQPLCGPARSCLQTGQYATTTGVWHNGIGLKKDATTLAKEFNQAGYHTSYIGKWHLSSRGQEPGPVAPDGRGGYQEWLAADRLESVSDAYRTRLWDTDSNPVDLPGYRVDALADAMIRYIDRAAKADKPFFLFSSFLEPHHQNHLDAFPAPTGYEAMYTGRWTPPDLVALPGSSPQHLGGYWGMIKRLDEAFGRVMDALKSLGLQRNTIVLFTSDHACHFKTRNGEYKRSCHDSSIRVPTLLAGPGFEGGGELPQLVSLVDLPPTLLDAAGLAVPDTMQGRSIMPLLRGQRDGWPQEVLVQISESETGRAVRTRRWKYAVTVPRSSQAKAAANSDRYTEVYLYDLENDPYELSNLVQLESHAHVREVMRGRLIDAMRRAGEAPPQIDRAEPRPAGQRSVTEDEAWQ